MSKKILLFGLLLCFCFSVFSQPSINEVLSDFPEDLIPSFFEGETIERYSVYGQDVASIAFD